MLERLDHRSRPQGFGRVLARAKRADLVDDDAIDDLVQRTVARVCNDAIGKKPVTTLMISRLEA